MVHLLLYGVNLLVLPEGGTIDGGPVRLSKVCGSQARR